MQQSNVDARSSEKKELDTLFPEEPDNVPDSVIAQLKQCKPNCKINDIDSKSSDKSAQDGSISTKFSVGYTLYGL